MKRIVVACFVTCALASIPGELSAQGRSVQQTPLAEASEIRSRAEAAGRAVTNMLADARLRRADAQARCLDRGLSELNAALRRIQRGFDDVRRGRATGDTRIERHVLSVLRVLAEQVGAARERAGRCVGSRSVRGPRTSVRRPNMRSRNTRHARRLVPIPPALPPPASPGR